MAEDQGFADYVSQIDAAYPKLGRIMSRSVIGYAQPNDSQKNDVLEYYAPWETDNPHFGRSYFEIYDKNKNGDQLRDLLAADSLHYLGAVQPNGVPVDPTWLKMKQAFQASMTPEQLEMNKQAYQEEHDPRTFDQWMSDSRTDAFLRGGLFPSVNPEWQKEGMFTPRQKEMLDTMKRYLTQ